ncbi:MAG: sugar transferase [Clostridiaceae bacterium]
MTQPIAVFPEEPLTLNNADVASAAAADAPGQQRPIRLAAETRESKGYLFVKRVFDILLSGLALIALSPLLLIIALVIFLDDPHGSPLFVQERAGKNGSVFKMLKFRSMVMDAEKKLGELLEKNEMSGAIFKIKEDPRITKVGRFIRRTSIDELPQLVNVLLGQMSIVGPRPVVLREAAQYTRYQKQRFAVTPGLTCIYQVQKNRYELSFEECVEMDLEYIRRHNFWLDCKLVWMTIGIVLRGIGA